MTQALIMLLVDSVNQNSLSPSHIYNPLLRAIALPSVGLGNGNTLGKHDSTKFILGTWFVCQDVLGDQGKAAMRSFLTKE
jgi:hypothetical protein